MERKPTVLICDDEADLLTMYTAALKRQFSVLTASSGKACKEKYMEHMLREKKINVVLLDYRLGDSKGDDIACKLCDLGDEKTILISAYDMEKERVDKLKVTNCIVDIIIKPVNLKVPFDRVQKELD